MLIAQVNADNLNADEVNEVEQEAYLKTSNTLYVAPCLGLIGWIGLSCLVVMLSMAIQFVAIQTFKIPSSSMFPTLQVGDNILVNKLKYGLCVRGLPFVFLWATPNRGDIVAFRGWSDDSYGEDYFVKRIVAIPGDTVQVRNSDIYVNGYALSNMVTKSQWQLSGNLINGTINNSHTLDKHVAGNRLSKIDAIVLKDNEYYVVGDNVDNSEDSRVHGPIHVSRILGKASFIYWSWENDTSNLVINWDRIGLRV